LELVVPDTELERTVAAIADALRSGKLGDGKNDFKREPNPPYGERGDNRKLTVTLPPDIYEAVDPGVGAEEDRGQAEPAALGAAA
jgi:hypothetical protein